MQVLSRIHPITPNATPAPSEKSYWINPLLQNPNRKIALPTMEGLSFERIRTIRCVEAKGNYTNIHFNNGTQILVCKTLREIEQLINAPLQFVRVHRSYTINLDYLSKYIKGKGGYVILEGGQSINVSAGRKPFFLESLEKYFG